MDAQRLSLTGTSPLVAGPMRSSLIMLGLVVSSPLFLSAIPIDDEFLF